MIVLILALGFSSPVSADDGRERMMKQFIDGCRLLTEPAQFRSKASADLVMNAVACQAAVETGLAIGSRSGKITQLGKEVCFPEDASAIDVAKKIAALPLISDDIYRLPKPSDVVVMGFITAYLCPASTDR